MRRRECKNCGIRPGEWKTEKESGARVFVPNPILTGKLVNRKKEEGQLPGLPGHMQIRISTVQCTVCGRKWQYRKKAKKVK